MFSSDFDIEEFFDMDVESMQAYNNTIDTQYLIKEEDRAKTDSMSGLSHTVHTSTYRSHATSSDASLANIEYTDEIIEFDED